MPHQTVNVTCPGTPALAVAAQVQARATAQLLGTGGVIAACSARDIADRGNRPNASASQPRRARRRQKPGTVDGNGERCPRRVAGVAQQTRPGIVVRSRHSLSAQPSTDAALARLDASTAALRLITIKQTVLRPLRDRGPGARRQIAVQAALALPQMIVSAVLLMPLLRP
jgi:hypothetical protein